MINLLWIGLAVIAGVLLGAWALHLLPRLGPAGRALSRGFCRAPMLDIAVSYFLVLPPVAGALAAPRFDVGSWAGLGAAILGQVVALHFWSWGHELVNPAARRGPRIVKVLNRVVGRFRNHAALWVTALAVPLFWLIRLAQWFVYPPLTWLVGLPVYRSGEWINVSRQKFEGLVGHDLIWCLYCDWMTGVWSLGSEMLRNVESFWCPIRFADGKKCENCRIDFPDVDGGDGVAGWVAADATMAEVTALVERQYGGEGPNAWFGHPIRLTVEGRDPDEAGEGEGPGGTADRPDDD